MFSLSPTFAIIISALCSLCSNVSANTTFNPETTFLTTIGLDARVDTVTTGDISTSTVTSIPDSDTTSELIGGLSTTNATVEPMSEHYMANTTLEPKGEPLANATLDPEGDSVLADVTPFYTNLTTDGSVSVSALDNADITFENQTENPIKRVNSTVASKSYEKIICANIQFDQKSLMAVFMYCQSFSSFGEKNRCIEDVRECIAKQKDKTPINVASPSYIENEVASAIMRYFSPVVIFSGTIMNFLAFIVLTFTKLREMSSSMYLITLSLTDTLNLTLMLMRDWIIALWKIDYRESHIVLCKGGYFLAYYVSHVSAWLLVAVTVERLVTVYFPLKAKIVCTRKNAGLVIAAILSFFLLLDGFLLWVSGPHYNLKNERRGTLDNITCHDYAAPEQKFFRLQVWPWLDMAIAAILPFIILLTCNVMIIVNLTRAARWRKASNTGGSAKQDDSTNSMTAMLLAISFIFVILTLPVTIYFILLSTNDKERNFHEIARANLAYAITKQLFFINCAINFLLYCIAGKRFRGELVNLFCGTKDVAAPGTRITYASRQSSNSGIALNNSLVKQYKISNGET